MSSDRTGHLSVKIHPANFMIDVTTIRGRPRVTVLAVENSRKPFSARRPTRVQCVTRPTDELVIHDEIRLHSFSLYMTVTSVDIS